MKQFDRTNLTFAEIEQLSKLVEKIKRDKSHITIKVVQVCNLLRVIREKRRRGVGRGRFGY